MSTCKHLYMITYACKHTQAVTFTNQLSREMYYRIAAGNCPSCPKVAGTDEKPNTEEQILPPEPMLFYSRQWQPGRHKCESCGRMLARRKTDTADGPKMLCRGCRTAIGAMDGRTSHCFQCGANRMLWVVTDAAGISQRLCQKCYRDATGKKAPNGWARCGQRKKVEND